MTVRLRELAASARWSLMVFACLAMFDAHAAPQGTFVASTGLDTNACAVGAPCRSFTTAMGQVADGGEVIVLDSARYGPVVITKSVSIVAPTGVYAGISVQGAGTNGIEINTAGIVVVLRGLTINGLGGDHGIRFQNGASVTVENCIVSGMSINGLFADAPGSRLTVRDSRFRQNGGAGAAVVGNVVAEFERVQADSNAGSAFDIGDGARVSLKSVSAQQNSLYGVIGTATFATTTEILVDDSQFVYGQAGVYARSDGGVVLVSIARTTVMHVNSICQHSVSTGSRPDRRER